jgi:hypothetical protein
MAGDGAGGGAGGGADGAGPGASTPSIPTRFQTVLQPAACATDAFGNRCSRFSQPISDVPGAGFYYSAPSAIKRGSESASLSKLGYGVGFVSKTDRFIRDAETEKPPGPGYYYRPLTLAERDDFSAARHSAAFSGPKRARPARALCAASAPQPAPGQYDPAPPPSPRYKQRAPSAAFASASGRGLQVRSDAPAPGTYHRPVDYTAIPDAKGAPSAFRSSTTRGAALLPRHLLETPGPGSYNAAARVATAQAKISSMFAPNAQDRFATPVALLKGDLPGPGAYDPPKPRPISAAAAVSAFKSTQRGLDAHGWKPPGPAYYNPAPTQVADKRSFLLNVTNKWV